MIDGILVLGLAYLVGSISGSMVVGRFRRVDIRTMGSGNAGGTNALRTQGWRFALPVVLIDVGKGVLVVAAVPALLPLFSPSVTDLRTLAAACGLVAVAGHVWPVYFRFRGGKGAGTAAGVIGCLIPSGIVPLLVLWIVTILLTGYVGLATVLAAVVFLPLFWLLGAEPMPVGLLLVATGLTLLILYTHRSNIRRLLGGTENRFEGARIFRRRP